MNKQRKQSAKSNNKGSIRIIAGKHRGRKLPVLMAEGLRPTTDRVKETVFNWLMPYIQDSICLDCFAGSGGLGFEALSRGAEQVHFVELNKTAVKQLQENQRLLKADNVTVTQGDVLNFINNNAQKFDVVFLDPPFRKNFVEQTTKLLDDKSLADNALIYVEMESEQSEQQVPINWQLLKEKVAGQVVYRLYQKNG
jgi:16S rRNA (guanine966-N2)-methyltransferase